MATLYLTEQYASVKRDGECLIVQMPAEEKGGERRNISVPLLKVDQVVVVGNVTLTTPALMALLEQEVEVCWLSYYGHFRGRLHSTHSKNAPLRLAQHKAHCDAWMRGEIGRAIVRGKLKNMRAVLLRYARSRDDVEIASKAGQIGAMVERVSRLNLGVSGEGVDGTESYAVPVAARQQAQQAAGAVDRDSLLLGEDDGVFLGDYAIASSVDVVGVGMHSEAEQGDDYDCKDLLNESIEQVDLLDGGENLAELTEMYALDLALSSDEGSGAGRDVDGRVAQPGQVGGRGIIPGRMHGLGALLGLEGAGSAAYFSVFGRLLKPEWARLFSGRVKRPPTDPVNALLSFGYTLLATQAMAAASIVGFDPYIGYLHAAGYGKPALALDLIEEFRPLIVDSVVITLLNTGVLKQGDFVWENVPALRTGGERPASAVRLTDGARKVFLARFEERLRETIKHPVFGYKASYRRCMEMQARLLAKAVTGEIPRYVPFVVR